MDGDGKSLLTSCRWQDCRCQVLQGRGDPRRGGAPQEGAVKSGECFVADGFGFGGEMLMCV